MLNNCQVAPVPEALKSYNNWVLWKLEQKPDKAKPDKIPYDARTGRRASSTDAATWADYHTAAATFERGGYDGIGFVFDLASPYGFVDIDDCLDANGTNFTDVERGNAALSLIDAGAAWERSQSGTGLHIVGRVDKLVTSGKKSRWPGWEFYREKRFCAFGRTGWQGDPDTDITRLMLNLAPDDTVAQVDPLPSGPRPEWTLAHLDDDEIIRIMLAERPSLAASFGDAASIRDLWDGNEEKLAASYPADSGEGYNASAADLGLMSKLAFYAGCDPERMDRIFRMSALGKRDKWIKRGDYRAMTISKAIAGCANVYSQPQTTLSLNGPLDGEIVPASDPLPIAELSHVELADAAVHFLGPRWRYVPAWKQWYRFGSDGWREDSTIHHEIGNLCQAASRKKELATEGTKRSMGSFSTVSGVTKLAQANPAIIAQPDDFDAKPWLLATPDGVVDLRTGDIRPAKPDDLTTMLTAVAPADAEDCPRWHQFIDEATGGDCDLAIYLQKLAGYALTGIASEQQLWVFTGQGGNGKGTLTQTLQRLLGSYAKEATPETFVNTRNSQHLAFIASLHRKRFVSVAEMPRNVSWNLQRIQSFTGGDAVEANFMAGNPFTFVPQFTLVISANEPPMLSAADNAVRRRFRFVPFDHTPAHRDRDLGEKLQAEWPGILRWAINGCLTWQREGLNPPPAVTLATDEQIDGDDYIGQWLEDESTVAPGEWASNRTIHESYSCWARDNGGPEMSMNSLGRRLRGYKLLKGFGGRDGKQRGWIGRKFHVPVHVPLAA